MFYKSVKVWMRESVWKCKRVNSEIDFCTDLRAVGAKVALHTPDHPPLRKPLHFFCPFKSFLVTQSNLNKWRGATPPSGMVLFWPRNDAFPPNVKRWTMVGFVKLMHKKIQKCWNILPNRMHIWETLGFAYF